ncbi:MAG: adenylate/guanylate cyclase domain-containing protein [Thermodesulfobacteriota bacterium]
MEKKLITSKDILDAAGISRATLNNYIKLGILPRPIVSAPGPDEEGVKQIGYFPAESLSWIRQVSLLKKQGKSMDDIASLFRDKDWVRAIKDEEEPATIPVQQFIEKQEQDKARRYSETDGLQVTIENLQSPAYLINNNLEIEWINEQAEELIFHQKLHAFVDLDQRNIFKLLLAPHSHGAIANWQDLLPLHCTLLQRNLSLEKVSHPFRDMSAKETELLRTVYQNKQPQAVDNIYCLPFSIVDAVSGERKHFLVHGETFREGIFVVFLPADQESTNVLELLAQRKKVIQELLDNRIVSMLPLCTLVASIQDPERVCAELLPSQYFQLVNELWQAVSPVFDKYSATYGNHGGNDLLYYFIKNDDNSYLINTINCAIEVNDIASLISSKYQSKMLLSSPLALNIGIHEGREFFGTIRSGRQVEFTSMGDSVRVARRLSELGSGGEIWATKDLITKITASERDTFTFGVYRDQGKGKVLQENSFSLAADLLQENAVSGKRPDPIAGLGITEITTRTGSNEE